MHSLFGDAPWVFFSIKDFIRTYIYRKLLTTNSKWSSFYYRIYSLNYFVEGIFNLY